MCIKGKNLKIRGYEYFENVFTAAAVTFCQHTGMIKLLHNGVTVEQETAACGLKNTSQEYVDTVIDWLIIHGYAESQGATCSLTIKGETLFAHSESLTNIVALYAKVVVVLKHASLAGFKKVTFSEEELALLTQIKIDRFPLLTVAAVSFLECVIVNSEEQENIYTVKDYLLQYGSIDVKNIKTFSIKNCHIFLNTLVDAKVLDKENKDKYILTDSGRVVLPLAGYATLVMSYLIPLSEMSALAMGDANYGLNQDVCRDAELNALASNGIIKIKVSPAIVNCLDSHDIFSKHRNSRSVFIDYGSGGGDMLVQVASATQFNAELLCGIDINPDTVKTAQNIIATQGLSEKILFETGSIVDEACLSRVQKILSAKNQYFGAASINFILHDIGPDLSKKFLRAHATVFPSFPLIITESLRIPREILAAFPHYQAPTFQFMHDISSQVLYTEEELRNMLEESGYRIMYEKIHASIPAVNEDSRLPTIITWIAIAGGANPL